MIMNFDLPPSDLHASGLHGLILEGIPGTGKTSLCRNLVRALPDWHRGPLWLATEHVTERRLEPLAATTPAQAGNLARGHLRLLETLAAMTARAPRGLHTAPLFLLERFHLSLAVHVPGLRRRARQAWERDLLGLNTLLVLLVLDPEDVLRRTVEEPSRQRNEAWGQYLQTLGFDPQRQADHFLREQRCLEALFRESRLPGLLLNTSAGSPEDCRDTLLAVLKARSTAVSAAPARSPGGCPGG